ncbi:hypothetical protein AN639_11295 [Candidatus Epulonipiscium fishelsonii]|uniref:Uncharacterized protein n=1 Tax=Candidatus Epulonipiscium fishelsonii TaxID=77094 RepID=A0ACC8XEZ3_9FIRM|nr:hypothetical protein AN396_02755 [Epulopiscium sp. SCG-B11WGA-EpuloA1]ONI43109.1 hypothetical protein AN639_11295 [Epulopiscium sp. SCG-B05WGA-EpuloA1]
MERNIPKYKRYDLLGPTVVKALEKRHFEAYYCKTKEEAKEQVLSLIPETDVVSWGGSMTLSAVGIIDAVIKRNPCINRDDATTPEEAAKKLREAFSCDTYLLSSNAISEDGQLYNIDGAGNRVAALSFGPNSVIVVAGMNKVVQTLEDAFSRAKTIAAPINAQRFDLKTPCKSSGNCVDCLSPDSICVSLVNTRMSRPPKRIKVVLIGEEFGF